MTDLTAQGEFDLSDPANAPLPSPFGSSRRGARGLLTAIAVAVILTAALCLGISHVRYERAAEAQLQAALQTERANATLQDELSRMRDQLAAAGQALSVAQSRVAALSAEAEQQQSAAEQTTTSKADRIAQLAHALEQAQRELHLTEAQRVTLMARLSKAENELAEGQARRQQAEEWQRKLQQLSAERDRAAAERDQLRARVGELEQRLSMQMRQPQRPVAEAPAQAAPSVAAISPQPAPPSQTQAQAQAQTTTAQTPTAPPPAAATTQQVAVVVPAPTAVAPAPPAAESAKPAPSVAVAHGGLAQFERVLASAGVDVARLFAQYGVRTGEGGPFIPVARGSHPEPTLSPEKVVAIGRLMRVLPVSAPLQSYEVGSPFGIRGDPINGRASFHTGLDMLAPYMSPVYATAPGVVTYSGYRDDYGKVVEIDHGNGISTRYAHLHRAVVSVGQRVEAHTQIGFLGSTGRATGPHVHYEVLVNGEPQDPAKFLGLAHLITVAQH